ncbi:MAG: FAD:protein FMN transferase [Candidatus Limnocylindrales bacterium]
MHAPGIEPPQGAEPSAEATTDLLRFSGRALGSRLKLFVSAPSGRPADNAQDAARAAWDAVVAEFAAVDASLSRFRDDSELTALNRHAGSGRVALVSWRLRTMLATAHRAARLTNGRFDATVLDVLERIGEHGASTHGDGALLASDAPADPLALVPTGTPRASLVHVPDLPVDSGGVGKGLALRWAVAAAAPALPHGAGLLLDAGGDILCAGTAPPEGWLVGVEDPLASTDQPGDPLAVCALRTGGVSTSSVAVRNWTGPDGRPVHHLIDPAMREPARSGLVSVTVAGPDPAWNEVWSKALFLGGSESIGEEARRRGLAAWWVDERGRLGMTPEARVRSPWVDEARVG